jgi:outer membrane receptor protein involved in Fe transport
MLFRPNESLTLNGSFSKMEQYSHILSFSKLSNKSDLFVNSTDTIKPSEAWQADVGTNYTYSNFIFGADLYYKTMKQLIDYKESASYSINQSDLQEEIEVGRGASYGLELFIQKNKGKLNGFISYTLSQSERVFPGINSGKSFAFNYDKAHQLNINLNYNITDNLLVTALWVFNSGIPFSMGSVAYPSIDNFQLYAGGPNYTDVVVFNKNSSRLPAYHRLDLGFSYTHHARFGKGTISAGCYNAYNRKNAYRYIVEERSGLHYFVKTEQYLFPILPYVSYKIEF